MESKIYTSQEMREAANALVDGDVANYISVLANDNDRLKPVSGMDVVAMLRQTAEMHERAELMRFDFHSIPETRDIIDYILRGDAGKEER